MAKEQLAVIEMVTNMILGKTGGISKVDFVPQKIRCPEPQSIVYENPGQTFPRNRYAPLYGIAPWKCHL